MSTVYALGMSSQTANGSGPWIATCTYLIAAYGTQAETWLAPTAFRIQVATMYRAVGRPRYSTQLRF